MTGAPDAIVIGGGHNGLVAAALLARRGMRPLVLEARNHAGGMLGDAEFPISPMPFALRPEICRALAIDVATRPMETIVASPLNSLSGTLRVSGSRLDGGSPQQAEAFRQLVERLARQAEALSGMLLRAPPRLDGAGPRDLLALAGTGWKLRRLGKVDLRDLLRIALSNVHDLVEDELGLGLPGALLAMEATLGGAMGPRSPGTVLTLLYRMASNGGRRMMPVGGPGALTQALAAAVTRAGGEIRLNAPVERILVEGDRAAGVALSNGEIVRASLVLSSAAPRTTLLDLLGPGHLDAEWVRRCRNMACTGMVARLDFDLLAPPRLAGGEVLEADQRLVVAADAGTVETAFNAAKHGKLPDDPVMEACYDAGSRRLRVSVQFIPHSPRGGWTEANRQMLETSVRRQLGFVLAGFEDSVTASRMMAPADIETAYGIPGGHQMLMLRPFDGAAGYRMPVEGLYLCGAGSHPGGDISGAPGFNAANAALAARRH